MTEGTLLNKYLQPLGSPVDNVTGEQEKYVPWQWGVIQGVQVKKIRSSSGYFKKITGGTIAGATVNSGTIGTTTFSSGTITLSVLNGGTQSGSLSAQGTITVTGTQSVRQVIPLVEAGASGGAPTSFFTSSSTPQGLDNSRFQLNPQNFPANKFYIEAVYRAGTSGQSLRTFFMDVYDITGGSAVAGGTLSGTTQSGAGFGVYPRERSTTDFGTALVAGNRDYILRYWVTSASGTTFADLYSARLVLDF